MCIGKQGRTVVNMDFEFAILNYIQTLRFGALDACMLFVSQLVDKGLLWLALAAVLLAARRTRRVAAALLLALILGHVLGNGVAKHIFARVRPCNVNLAAELLLARPHSYSFPSGHACLAFCTIATLHLAQLRALFWPALLVGVLVCASRIYLYVHFPTDILAGAALGCLCAYSSWRLLAAWWRDK